MKMEMNGDDGRAMEISREEEGGIDVGSKTLRCGIMAAIHTHSEAIPIQSMTRNVYPHLLPRCHSVTLPCRFLGVFAPVLQG